MKFAIRTAQQNVTWLDLLEFWRFLDRETVFESFWMMDHLVPPSDDTSGGDPCFECWTLLAAAARATKRLRLGALLSAPTFRDDELVTKMAVSVQRVSHGRLELGLGTGWNGFEHQTYGVPLRPIRERMDRLEEAARVLRSLFDAESTPRPPVTIGAGGGSRTLAIVARYADVANLTGPLSAVKHQLGVLRQHCDMIRRDYDEIEKTAHVPVLLQEDPEVLDAVAPVVARQLDISEEAVRTEIPFGNAEQVRETVARFEEAGITTIHLPCAAPFDFRAMRMLSEEVAAPLA